MIKAKEMFIARYWAAAVEVGSRHGLHPCAILAVAGKEGAWGTSYSARHRNNFFGLKPGGKFAVFADATACFDFFGRLLARKYAAAVQASSDPDAFGQRMAYSRYVAEPPAGKQAYARSLPAYWREVAKVAQRLGLASTPLLAERTTFIATRKTS